MPPRGGLVVASERRSEPSGQEREEDDPKGEIEGQNDVSSYSTSISLVVFSRLLVPNRLLSSITSFHAQPSVPVLRATRY